MVTGCTIHTKMVFSWYFRWRWSRKRIAFDREPSENEHASCVVVQDGNSLYIWKANMASILIDERNLLLLKPSFLQRRLLFC